MNPLQILTNILTSTGLKVAGSVIAVILLLFLAVVVYEMILRIQKIKQDIKLNEIELEKV